MSEQETIVCGNCGGKTYCVTDTVHYIYICWTCGAFGFYPERKDDLEKLLLFNPDLLFEMIKMKHLVPSE